MSYDKVSLSKILFMFYIIIILSNSRTLLGPQMQSFINDDRIMQHFIAFSTMVVLVITFGNFDNTKLAIIYSAIGYLWFILTTKLDLHWNVAILLLLFMGYLYENNLDIKNKEINDDKNMPPKIKNKLIENNNHNKTYMLLSILFVTIIGTLFYFDKKQIQYGGKFDLLTYMFY